MYYSMEWNYAYADAGDSVEIVLSADISIDIIQLLVVVIG